MLSNPSEIYGILNLETCGDGVEHFNFLLHLKIPVIQIRAKDLPLSEVKQFVEQFLLLRNAADEATSRIVINDYVDIALEKMADGIHLGQEDLAEVDLEQLRLQLGPEAIIGVSTHNLEQAKAADALPVTYIAVGPIFPSTTKVGHAEVIGLSGLRSIASRLTKPIVAIGGITLENRSSVIEAGAGQVALISALEELRNRSKIE